MPLGRDQPGGQHVTGSAIAAPAMNNHTFSQQFRRAQEWQDVFDERLVRAQMMVFNRPHENSVCAELPPVFGPEID